MQYAILLINLIRIRFAQSETGDVSYIKWIPARQIVLFRKTIFLFFVMKIQTF